jgi:hypothetical protein
LKLPIFRIFTAAGGSYVPYRRPPIAGGPQQDCDSAGQTAE